MWWSAIRTGGDIRSKSVAVQRRFNAASVLSEGRVLETYAKRELPNYQVFDERRYFTPGQGICVFQVEGVSVGLLICEDAWFDEPGLLAKESGAELLAVHQRLALPRGQGRRARGAHGRAGPRAGPAGCLCAPRGRAGRGGVRRRFLRRERRRLRWPAVRRASRKTCSTCRPSAVRRPRLALSAQLVHERSPEADLWDALVLGVRDYIGKNGFPGVLLGLSGGIDSALVLAVAVDALGRDKVRAVMMPSPYTADISWIDARDMAARLGVRYDEISITPEFEAFKSSLASEFKGLPEDTTEENIQARIRGVFLMALSNKFGSIVLTTGNKSEMATGYCTLYGDMAGGFAVIKDLLKTTVFRLARWRNIHDPYGAGISPIPERIITRPPSAELRPDQVDQDSLPPYEVLDAILERYMENDEGVEEIIAAGFDRAVVERVARLIRINEYKRRQAPVGIRVTHRSFGKDWRYPITGKFRA